MPQTEDGLTVLPPSPLEDERRPLLDVPAGQPNHGTIQETQDGGESGIPIAEEPSTKKILLIIGCLWIGSFFAALGMFGLSERDAWVCYKLIHWMLIYFRRLYNCCYTGLAD